MMRLCACSFVVAMCVSMLGGPVVQAADKMLAHDVYFSLKDNSLPGREKFLTACKKYLAGHPGMVRFDAGVRAEALRREVNDLDFDVALHVVFKDKEAHDAYQTAPKHLKFIEENGSAWEKVRVFDSFIEISSGGEKSKSR